MSHGLDEPGFTEGMLADNPLTQFAAWMADTVAAGLPEPTAMVLATVSADGRPRVGEVEGEAEVPASANEPEPVQVFLLVGPVISFGAGRRRQDKPRPRCPPR